MKKLCLQLLCAVLLLVLPGQVVRADVAPPGAWEPWYTNALVTLIVLGVLVVILVVVAWLVIRGIKRKAALEDPD